MIITEQETLSSELRLFRTGENNARLSRRSSEWFPAFLSNPEIKKSFWAEQRNFSAVRDDNKETTISRRPIKLPLDHGSQQVAQSVGV